MDPQGVQTIGAYLTFWAGLIGLAMLYDVLKISFMGLVFYVVAKRVLRRK